MQIEKKVWPIKEMFEGKLIPFVSPNQGYFLTWKADYTIKYISKGPCSNNFLSVRVGKQSKFLDVNLIGGSVTIMDNYNELHLLTIVKKI